MAYQSDLSSWGATGTEPPANYSYEEGEQPVDEWDNWFNYTVISELTDVIDLINDIDADTDGVVDDSDQFDGTAPSDGVDAQFLQTDGTTTSWGRPSVVSTTEPSGSYEGQRWVRADGPGTEITSTDNTSGSSSADVTHYENSIYSTHDFNGGGVAAHPEHGGSASWVHTLHSDSCNAVAAVGDTVFSGGSDNTVIAADRSDGSERWTSNVPSSSIQGIAANNSVVVAVDGGGGNIHALDASDGSELWSDNFIGSAADVDIDEGYVYTCYSNVSGTNIRKMELDGGAVNNSWDLNTASGIAVEDHTIYLAVGVSEIVAYDARSDNGEVWVTSTADSSHNVSYNDGVVYASGNLENDITAIDVETGSVLWEQASPNGSPNSTAAAKGMLYVANDSSPQIDLLVSSPSEYVYIDGEWLFKSKLR